MKTLKQYIHAAAALLVTGTLLLSSCDKESDFDSTPVANAIEPGTASGGDVLTITGAGLAGIQTIYFEKDSVPAAFNPNFNTESAILFRVPDSVVGGEQNVVLQKANGKKTTISVNIVALPTVSAVSNYNFEANSEITLTGTNLSDVTAVTLTGGNTPATIVSKAKKELVIKMPVTNETVTTLKITNSSGTATTTQEFVNMDKAFKIFTDDYAPGFQDASWGDPGIISSTVFKTGSKSVGKTFAKGNWHQIGFGWTNISNDNYRYLTFWIKGASKEYPLWISTAASPGGFASFNDFDKITVPANVWTYFKLPIGPLKLWDTATSFNQIGWRIQGPDTQDETFYLDDVMLVK